MAAKPTSADATETGQIKAEHSLSQKWSELIFALSRIFARVALGISFLSAVTDRFGLWGAYGQPNGAWGDFQHFVQYTGLVNSFLPARLIPAIAWAATIAEAVFGLGLLLGLDKRFVASGSAVLWPPNPLAANLACSGMEDWCACQRNLQSPEESNC